MDGSGFLVDGSEGSGTTNTTTNDTGCINLLDLATTQTGVLHYHATVLVVIMAASIFGNALVLVLFARFEELRTRSVVVSMSMVVADLLFTLAYTFQVIVTTAAREWLFGDIGCIIFGFMTGDLIITRWIIVSLLCLDRFLLVRFPFSYQRQGGKWVLITSTVLAWVIPVITSVIPLGFATFELRETQPGCLPSCSMEEDNSALVCRAYYFLVFTIIYVLGSIVPIILYSWLYCKARRLKKSTNHTLGHLTIQIAGGIVISQPVGEQNNAVGRENQATITFVLIFASVVITGTPGYILQVLRSLFFELQCRLPILVHFIVIEIFLCAPMLTPLVIMRDRAFRKCLLQFFHCRRKTGDLQIGNRSSSDNRFFSGIHSRRSSVVASSTTSQESVSSNDINPQESYNTRTRRNSIVVRPAVYTISESSESPPHSPSTTKA